MERSSNMLPIVLDPAKLEELACLTNSDCAKSVARVCIEELKEFQEKISVGRAQPDMTSLSRIAHSIVGSTGALGAIEASVAARTLEHKCMEQNAEELQPAIDMVLATCRRAIEALEGWVEDGGRGLIRAKQQS